jgi:hypothetical protein
MLSSEKRKMSDSIYYLDTIYGQDYDIADKAAADAKFETWAHEQGWIAYHVEVTEDVTHFMKHHRYVYEVPMYKEVRSSSHNLAQRVVNDHGNMNITFDFVPLRPLMYQGRETRGIVIDGTLYVAA